MPVGPHCSVAAAGSVVVHVRCAEYGPGAGAETSVIANPCGTGAVVAVAGVVVPPSFREPALP